MLTEMQFVWVWATAAVQEHPRQTQLLGQHCLFVCLFVHSWLTPKGPLRILTAFNWHCVHAELLLQLQGVYEVRNPLETAGY